MLVCYIYNESILSGMKLILYLISSLISIRSATGHVPTDILVFNITNYKRVLQSVVHAVIIIGVLLLVVFSQC